MRFPARLVGIVALVALVTAASVPRLAKSVHQAREARIALEKEWHDSVMGSRTLMASQLAETADDKSLLQNLGWGYMNSVSQSLQSRLRMGEVEQIEIFDANCKSLVRVHLRASISAPCESGPAKHFWSKNESMSVLAMSRPLGDKFIMVGSVPLDEQWLVIKPRLAGYLRKFDITLTADLAETPENTRPSGSRGQIIQDGTAMLTTGNLVLSWLGQASAGSQRAFDILHFFALALAAAAGFSLILRLTEELRRSKIDHDSFTKWCLELLPAETIVEKIQPMEKNTLTPVKHWQKIIDAALAFKTDQIRSLQTQRKQLDNVIEDKDRQLAAWAEHLAELSELDSLAEQMRRSTKAFLGRQIKLRERIDTLDGAVTEIIQKQAGDMAKILGTWRDGVRERGSRKFIRSLSETEGRRKGTSVLDEEIETLSTLAEQVVDGALHTTLQIRELEADVTFTSRIASFWFALAAHKTDEDGSDDVATCAAHAESLVHMAPGFEAVRILWGVQSTEETLFPKLPAAVLTSALYHLYLAVIESTSSDTGARPSLVARLRPTPSRTLLVVSAQTSGATLKTSSVARRRGAFHAEIASALLKSWNCELVRMPVIEGESPLAIGWKTKSEDATASSDLKLLGALSAPIGERASPENETSSPG
jgi:hypothetical protein